MHGNKSAHAAMHIYVCIEYVIEETTACNVRSNDQVHALQTLVCSCSNNGSTAQIALCVRLQERNALTRSLAMFCVYIYLFIGTVSIVPILTHMINWSISKADI